MAIEDDAYAKEVIRTVADLTKRFEAMVKQLEQFQRHADDERKKLRAGVDATVEAMRKDFHKAISSLQLNASQHRDEHSADRMERATDSTHRSNRQLVWDLWMGALTLLGVINLALSVYLIAQVAR